MIWYMMVDFNDSLNLGFVLLAGPILL